MVTLEEAKYYSDKATIEGGGSKLINSYRDEKGKYPKTINWKDCRLLNIKRENYMKWAEEKNKELIETGILQKNLQSQRITDFLKEEIPKEHPIIKNILPEKSITIIYGAPASCKSIFTQYMGFCIATQRRFLDVYPTRKQNVLFLSTENPKKTDRKRFNALCKGMGINARRRSFKNFKFRYLNRKSVGYLSDDDYFESLSNEIEKNNIEVLIIDTISPLISNLDDNRASEMVRIFNNNLFSLVDKFNLSIILTMHSQKSEKDFLGSVKIKASADVFYELKRDDDNTDVLFLNCHKNRDGEHNLEMSIKFLEKKDTLKNISFEFLKEFKGKQTIRRKEKKKQSEKAEEIVLQVLEENGELQYKNIVLECEKLGEATATIKRAINSLYETKKILKKHGKRGGYYVS